MTFAEPIGIEMGPQGQPVDAETGRFFCTKEMPMPDVHSGQWIHRDAKDDGINDPYYDGYICPNCGHHFKVEVAE